MSEVCLPSSLKWVSKPRMSDCECVCVHACVHRQGKPCWREPVSQAPSTSEIIGEKEFWPQLRSQELSSCRTEVLGASQGWGGALPTYSLGPPQLCRHSPSGPTSFSTPVGFEMKGGKVCPAFRYRALPAAEYLGNRVRAVGQEMTSQVSPLQGQLPAETKPKRYKDRGHRDGSAEGNLALSCPPCQGRTEPGVLSCGLPASDHICSLR